MTVGENLKSRATTMWSAIAPEKTVRTGVVLTRSRSDLWWSPRTAQSHAGAIPACWSRDHVRETSGPARAGRLTERAVDAMNDHPKRLVTLYPGRTCGLCRSSPTMTPGPVPAHAGSRVTGVTGGSGADHQLGTW